MSRIRLRGFKILMWILSFFSITICVNAALWTWLLSETKKTEKVVEKSSEQSSDTTKK